MSTIQAVFEGGVFRPIQPVDLPEHAQVEFEPRVVEPAATELDLLRQSDPALAAVYEVLARRHHSGLHDTAERHNEHQP